MVNFNELKSNYEDLRKDAGVGEEVQTPEDLRNQLEKIKDYFVADEDNFEDVYRIKNKCDELMARMDQEDDEEYVYDDEDDDEECDEIDYLSIVNSQMESCAMAPIQFVILDTENGQVPIYKGVKLENENYVTIQGSKIVKCEADDENAFATNAEITEDIICDRAMAGGALNEADFLACLKCVIKNLYEKLNTYKIPVEWLVCDTVTFKGKSLEDAILRFEKVQDEYPLGTEPDYVDGTYRIVGYDGSNLADAVKEIELYN